MIDPLKINKKIKLISHPDIDKLCKIIEKVKVCFGNYIQYDFLPEISDILKNMTMEMLIDITYILINVNNPELDKLIIRVINEDKRISSWIDYYRINERPQSFINFYSKLCSSEGIKEAITDFGHIGLREMLLEYYNNQNELGHNDIRQKNKLNKLLGEKNEKNRIRMDRRG